MNEEQAERIGAMYGQAVANFDTLGDFQLAVSNAMTYRSYNWDGDEFETVLSRFIEAEVEHNPASDDERYRELQKAHRSNERTTD